MSKLICDVCGTTYPETASQCPICGSATNSANQTAAASGDGSQADTSSYAYVKGGRFSKKNVRRINSGKSAPTTKRTAPARAKTEASAQRPSTPARREKNEPKKQKEPSNIGLIIVVVLLLLAIVAVLVYIGVQVWKNQETPDPTDNPSTQQTTDPTDNTTPSDQPDVPCQDILLTASIIDLIAEGETWKLEVELSPADCTDTVRFVTADPNVATVAPDGTITAVGEGSTVISIICGDITKNCLINCIYDQGSEPTDPPIEFKFEFDAVYVPSSGCWDGTFRTQGQVWKCFKGSLSVPAEDIIWTSDNTEICTIDQGYVTIHKPGTTRIHAQYNGITYTCWIRAVFEYSETLPDCKISHTDVSIKVGESFNLRLVDKDGNVLDIQWLSDNECVTINGNKITGAVAGTTKVYVEYEGHTYMCYVRVKAG